MFRLCLVVISVLSGVSTSAKAELIGYPYTCKTISSSEGYYQIIEYRRGCSLRQAPEKIWDCKREVSNKESAFFDQYEPSFEKNCYNKNGYTRTTTCLYNNTHETTGPHAHWYYQSAKMLTCHYK